MARILLGVLALLVVVTSIVLFAVSFDTFEPTELALDLDIVTQTINNQRLWIGGARELLGLTHKYIKFDGRAQTIKFVTANDSNALMRPVEARTSDGVKIWLNVTIMYRLLPTIENVLDLYFKWGHDVETGLRMVARQSILDVVSSLPVKTLFQNRADVTARINQAVGAAFKKQDVELLVANLENIDLPSQMVTAFTRTEIARMELFVKENEQITAGIKAETRRLESEKLSEITMLIGVAQAESLRLRKTAEATAVGNALLQELIGFQNTCPGLNFSAKELLAWVYMRALDRYRGSGIIGVDMGI